MIERWGDHADYPGYRFSTDGRVQRRYKDKWVEVKVNFQNNKAMVRMTISGKRIIRSLPVVILQVHCGPRPTHHQALRYPDSDIRNNKIENLRWAPFGASKIGVPFPGKRMENPPGPRKISRKQALQILQMASEDFTDEEIANRFKLSHTHVTKIINGMFWKDLPGRELIGSRLRKYCGENNHNSRFSDEERLEMVKLREKGLTYEEIGKRFNTDRSQAHRIVKNLKKVMENLKSIIPDPPLPGQ